MRRSKLVTIIGLAAIVALMLAACQPATVEVTRVVQEKVEVTRIVAGTPVVEVVTATPTPKVELPTEITLVDTNSGANFQWYWQNQVVPAIEEQLGIKVNYVVSKEAELLERMKAWEPGKGDAHLLFVKPETIPNALSAGIELETLYPDQVAAIPNIEKCPKSYLETVLGIPIEGKGALYWRSQYALIYNSEYIKNPPTSWKEFYERRAEWKGHIGLVRPDAKSGASYRIPYSFLNAFVKMTDENGKAIPLEELQKTPEWQDAWAKLVDFYSYAKLPIPAEPPNMFEDFNAGDTWISFYAMDYALWSRHQGTMPPTIKAGFLEEGMAAGSDGYLIVPAGIPEEYKPVVYKVINFLLSDDQQIRLITTMWQYTGTDIWDKIPGVVWDTIPPWDKMEPARLVIANKEVSDFIKEKGPALLVPKE
ncbi:MAG: extracellular solute-binding protein [Anaerolineae bacterium]|jgi:putative spermidine/putrescine transport system substrate-binding protein|nr:extracellular solute-binding protein [Anaerolineae bacterium]MDH7473454.1 extracellular solute-binding protein [Anaerolineae bacterium]